MTSVKGPFGPSLPFVDTSAPPAAAQRVQTPVVDKATGDAFARGGSFATALQGGAGIAAPPVAGESAQATLKALHQLLPAGVAPPSGVPVAEALQATSLDGFAHAPSPQFAAGLVEVPASLRVMFDGSLPLSGDARLALARRLDGWRAWVGAEAQLLAQWGKNSPRAAALLGKRSEGLKRAFEKRRGGGADPRRARARLLALGWDEEDLDELDDSWWPDLAALVDDESDAADATDLTALLAADVGELEGVHVDDAAAWIATVAAQHAGVGGLLAQVEQGFASLGEAQAQVLARDGLLATVERALLEAHGGDVALAAQRQVKVWSHEGALSFVLSPFVPTVGPWQRDPSPLAVTLGEIEAGFAGEVEAIDAQWNTLASARAELGQVLRAKVGVQRDAAAGLREWAALDGDVIRGRK